MSVFSLFAQSLIKENYVFFDVETTGLYPLEGDKIIEIAMIKTSKGNIIDTYESMINPLMGIPPESTAINKITDDMVKDAPALDKDLGKKLLDFIGDGILVAHNASFDLGFLSVELGRAGIRFEGWKAVDTLKMAGVVFAGQRNKLENLIRRYNILPDGNLHRALVDTDSLRKVFFELLEEDEIRSLNIEALIKKYGFTGQNIHRCIPAEIREALIENRVINGKYKKRTGENTDLSIIPVSPVWINGKWFLLAKNSGTEELVTLSCENFKVSE